MAKKSKLRKHFQKKSVRKQMKIKKVMHEFKKGTLRSSSGKKVTSRAQAIAIAMSEAGISRKKKKGRRKKSRK